MSKVARLYLQALYDEQDANGKYQRNNCVLAVPSGRITAAMRKEWQLNQLLWTDEQKNIHQQLDDERKLLQEQEARHIPFTEEECLRYAYLQNACQIPMDIALHQKLEEECATLKGFVTEDNQSKIEAQEKTLQTLQKKLKNRNDNRHHALDAVMIALVDPRLIQRQNLKNKGKWRVTTPLIRAIPPTLCIDLKAKIAQIVVSHKPDHATQGQLHEESARFKTMIKGEVKYIYNKKDYLAHGVVQDPINQSSVVGVTRKNEDLPYKYYKLGSSYCIEVYQNAKGKYEANCISTYTANQKAYQAFMRTPAFKTHTFDGQPLVMRLIKGDMLQIMHNGVQKVVYIQKASADRIYFNEHFESNCDARGRAKITGDALVMQDTSPNVLLSKYQAKKVLVNAIGRVMVLDNKAKQATGVVNVEEKVME